MRVALIHQAGVEKSPHSDYQGLTRLSLTLPENVFHPLGIACNVLRRTFVIGRVLANAKCN